MCSVRLITAGYECFPLDGTYGRMGWSAVRIDEGPLVVCNYWRAGTTFVYEVVRDNGPSPSGKAAGFGLAIPRFES